MGNEYIYSYQYGDYINKTDKETMQVKNYVKIVLTNFNKIVAGNQKLISFISNIVNIMMKSYPYLTIGRLADYKNRDFLSELRSIRDAKLRVLESESLLSSDSYESWVFFDSEGVNKISNLLLKYWECHDGGWVFMCSSAEVNMEKWVQIKKHKQYYDLDIEDFIDNYGLLINTLDDEQLFIYILEENLDDLYKVLNETADSLNLSIKDEPQN